MRFLPALTGALLITVAVFLFMQSLIRAGQQETVALPVYSTVEVFQQEREEEKPETEPETPREPSEEPSMASLEISPPTPEPATELEIPALDLAAGEIDIQAAGDDWSAPLGSGGIGLSAAGADAVGYVEVTPYNTRRPNVPEVAWRNRIDGWVLVAFTVTPDGRTREVRVLDAFPRGVFEEKVVAAVRDWRYSVSFIGKQRGDILLTQRVEVLWRNYPQNIPHVD
jgi:periplasmic protein TonB